MQGKSDAEAAAQEAYEEAGVVGALNPCPIGAYGYGKRLKSGKVRPVTVDVFSLEIQGQHDDWPEKDQRRLAWMTPAQAAAAVDEPGLAKLLSGFSPD